MQFDEKLAIARAIRRGALAQADESARWVIRKRKSVRIPSKTEREAKRVSGSMTCFHELPYTLACTKCKRSEADAERERARIAQVLRIQ